MSMKVRTHSTTLFDSITLGLATRLRVIPSRNTPGSDYLKELQGLSRKSWLVLKD